MNEQPDDSSLEELNKRKKEIKQKKVKQKKRDRKRRKQRLKQKLKYNLVTIHYLNFNLKVCCICVE